MPENDDRSIRVTALDRQRDFLGRTDDLEFQPQTEEGEALQVRSVAASKGIHVSARRRRPRRRYKITVTPIAVFATASQLVNIPGSGFKTVVFTFAVPCPASPSGKVVDPVPLESARTGVLRRRLPVYAGLKTAQIRHTSPVIARFTRCSPAFASRTGAVVQAAVWANLPGIVQDHAVEPIVSPSGITSSSGAWHLSAGAPLVAP